MLVPLSMIVLLRLSPCREFVIRIWDDADSSGNYRNMCRRVCNHYNSLYCLTNSISIWALLGIAGYQLLYFHFLMVASKVFITQEFIRSLDYAYLSSGFVGFLFSNLHVGSSAQSVFNPYAIGLFITAFSFRFTKTTAELLRLHRPPPTRHIYYNRRPAASERAPYRRRYGR